MGSLVKIWFIHVSSTKGSISAMGKGRAIHLRCGFRMNTCFMHFNINMYVQTDFYTLLLSNKHFLHRIEVAENQSFSLLPVNSELLTFWRHHTFLL